MFGQIYCSHLTILYPLLSSVSLSYFYSCFFNCLWIVPFFCSRFIGSVFAFLSVYTKSWHHVCSPGREARRQTVLESITSLVCCSCSLLSPQHREMSVTQRERGRKEKKTERKNAKMINTMTVKRSSTSLKWPFKISCAIILGPANKFHFIQLYHAISFWYSVELNPRVSTITS